MNFSEKVSPLVHSAATQEKMDAWLEAHRKGETPNVDVYGKPTEEHLKHLERVKNISKEWQENIQDFEQKIQDGEEMTHPAEVLDFSDDHEFVSANHLDNIYAQEDLKDVKEEEKRKLTSGKANKTEIQSFYKDQCVFLTGGTGFLGKVVIEKLLRSCGDIDTIYVLARSKKGKSATARIHEMLDDFLFEKAHQVNPKGIHKIVAINGDMESPGLGISEEDRKLLVSKVTIILNVAATVKFDEKLSVAYGINVRGTREVVRLARECRQLKALTHVSTAYSHTYNDHIEEKFYTLPVTLESIEAIHDLEENLLDGLTPAILNKFPNTYCFTKAVAEDAVRRYAEGMPVCIFRPSIVISTLEEPARGWTDSVYGPTGLIIGIGTGVLRAMYLNKHNVADMVPVDLTVNALLASAWYTAKNYRENQTSEIPIYNYVSGARNPLTWNEFMLLSKKHSMDKPTTKAVWYYGLNLTSNYYMFLFYNFFLHYIPALLIDSFNALIGKNGGMLQFYHKLMRMTSVLFYFSLRQWKFSDGGVQRMWASLSKNDKTLFPFDIAEMSWDYYMETFLLGLRVYVVKDDMSTLPEARKKWQRLYIMHTTLKIVVFGSLVILGIWLLKFFFSLFNLL